MDATESTEFKTPKTPKTPTKPSKRRATSPAKEAPGGALSKPHNEPAANKAAAHKAAANKAAAEAASDEADNFSDSGDEDEPEDQQDDDHYPPTYGIAGLVAALKTAGTSFRAQSINLTYYKDAEAATARRGGILVGMYQPRRGYITLDQIALVKKAERRKGHATAFLLDLRRASQLLGSPRVCLEWFYSPYSRAWAKKMLAQGMITKDTQSDCYVTTELPQLPELPEQ